MTHSIKTIGTVLAAALLATLALAGCKKEEPTSSFLLVGDSSIYFEYGQTKEVFYTTRNIASFYLPSVPEGWSCVRQSGKYVITAPSEGDSGALSEGDIRVSADAGDRRITRTITVAIRLAEEIVAPANSFIVSEPGKRYKFNARRRAGETAETLDATGANIMWVTAGAPVGHVSLENGYLYFATADGAELIPGNALVAATDKTGKVLWSWHIWVTDYDPAVDYHTAAGAKVMARNLGALAGSNASAEDVRDSYGLYYQWGRKDPFPGPAAWNSTATEPLFTSLGRYTNLSFATSSDETGTLEYIASRPMTFIAGTEENDYAWLWDDSDDTLWGGSEGSGDSGAKTIYDPCPAGWRVASSDL
ncbi:MAG: hypothetical protein LBV18_01890, partial [Alistipes sp.]|nr:hypothetical protein [Alistipes sp.]